MPRDGTVRPTSARVRGAIFDILGQSCEGDTVLDLYAGAGTLGIEALARGARTLVAVERDREVARVLQGNLTRSGGEGSHRLVRGDAVAVIRRLAAAGERFDVIFADPPYDAGEIGRILGELAILPLLTEDGVVVVEHSPREDGTERIGELRRFDRRVYGQTNVSFYERTSADREERAEGAAAEGEQR